MADTNVELDAINHLLEIEKQASGLISDAQIEADKRLTEARGKYTSEYKSKYETVAADLEKKYQEDYAAVTKKYAEEIEAYKKSLEEKNQNKEAFSKVIEKMLMS